MPYGCHGRDRFVGAPHGRDRGHGPLLPRNLFEAGPPCVPPDDAALGIPVAQHNPLRLSAINIDDMNGGSMSVAMQQNIHLEMLDGFLNGVLIYIHDFHALVYCLLQALPTRLVCHSQSVLKRSCENGRLPVRIARHLADALILHVIGAKQIAMAQ